MIAWMASKRSRAVISVASKAPDRYMAVEETNS